MRSKCFPDVDRWMGGVAGAWEDYIYHNCIYFSEKCCGTLKESSLNTLVQMLKTAVVTQIKSIKHDKTDKNLKALLETLKKVHTVRAHLKKCIYCFIKLQSPWSQLAKVFLL